MDLDAYCRRIGYSGPREASFEVLMALHSAHAAAISFESLDPFLKRPVSLEPDAIEAKLVHHARGGYCFEQNGLFLHVLRTLGFQVTPLAARVRWTLPRDAPATPLSHMLLIAHLPEGDYLCDVGFGGQNSTAPLRFIPDLVQENGRAAYRLSQLGASYELALRLPGDWAAMYRFTLEEQSPRDYEIYNWATSTHPASRFVQNLVAARVLPDARLSLLNRRFSIHYYDGRSEERELESATEVHAALAQEFGIEIEYGEIERNWPRLQRL